MRQDLARVLDNLPSWVSVDEGAAEAELDMTCETAQPIAMPMLYQVETTSKCNLRCPFCPRTTDLVQHGQRSLTAEMSLADFERILDSMPWLQSLEMFHFGEPFMQRDFHRFVEAAHRRGIYTVVASNLLTATPRRVDEVFAAGLDFLVMDVDSLDPARYAAARVNGSLETLRPIVQYILAHPNRPWCVAQTIMLDGKPEYTEDEFVAWAGNKPDEIRYKFLDSFRGEASATTPLGPTDLCREPFFGFTVHVNGNVVPCDRDWAGENVMGNILTQDPMEIWRGPKYERFRAEMKSACKPAMCRDCGEGRLVNLRSQRHIQVNMFKGERVEHGKR
jgi:radical SAM protein with 4Fe4S-binding SPASM domain